MRDRIAVIVIRAVFILLAAGLGLYIAQDIGAPPETVYAYLLVSLGIGIAVVVAESFSAKADIQTVSAVVFGIIVGTILANLFTGLVLLVADFDTPDEQQALSYIRLTLTLVLIYFTITVILRTRDDFKFIIPYVEFSKEIRGPRPWLIDTSALIDGRLIEVSKTGVIDAPVVVPKFVVSELHRLADSGDRGKRSRGRRGLDLLKELQQVSSVRTTITDDPGEGSDVDAMLVALARKLQGKIVTTDYNLSKVAGLHNVPVINLNDLAGAVKPRALPGECVKLKVERPGEEQEQGVGYLPDGTMVVIEQARAHVGKEVSVVVTSSYQSSAGLMLFGKLAEEGAAA